MPCPFPCHHVLCAAAVPCTAQLRAVDGSLQVSLGFRIEAVIVGWGTMCSWQLGRPSSLELRYQANDQDPVVGELGIGGAYSP